MKKKLIISALAVLAPAAVVWALVTVTAQPTSLVTSPLLAKASSSPIGLFKLSLNADSAETLSSIAVTVSNNGASTATGAEFSSLAVYRDTGDGVFDPASDVLAGSQTSVNIGSPTVIATASNNPIPATFFVALSTSSTWSDAAPADSITVSLAADGVVTSANSPTVTAASTSTITADTTGPQLTSVVASDTGGAPGLNAGDSLVFTFGEATTKPALTAVDLATALTLSSGHTYLDGLGIFASQNWNAAGTQFTVVLSGNVNLPTVAVGDTVTMAGSLIKDAVGNAATGAVAITGTFGVASDTTGPTLTSAVAADTGAAPGLNAGDTIVFTFNEATTKPVISAANVNSTLTLNNAHTYLDGLVALGATSWNAAGTQLTITLTTTSGVPSVVVGDTVTMNGSVIEDAAGNNATGTVSLTGTFGVASDTTGPVLTSAIAQNTGGNPGKEAGDSVLLTFGEATNKPSINSGNVNAVFALNNSHSWLDGAGNLGTASWNAAGTQLTITLSAGTSLPTIALADSITVSGSVVKDAMNNNATGSVNLSGNFGTGTGSGSGNNGMNGRLCDNGLIKGQLYQIEGSNAVYKVKNCKLKATNKSIITLPTNHGYEIVAKSDKRMKGCDHRRGNDNDNDDD